MAKNQLIYPRLHLKYKISVTQVCSTAALDLANVDDWVTTFICHVFFVCYFYIYFVLLFHCFIISLFVTVHATCTQVTVTHTVKMSRFNVNRRHISECEQTASSLVKTKNSKGYELLT